ncbi:MAG: GGDEF domain-containing protein [Deltaproteobacteria bacterium]|nr:GGDEF domain-containing protein [Deltaproteobacteria bacterium]
MFITFDTQTVLIFTSMGCFIVSAALFFAHAGRFRRDGMRLWTLGYAVKGVAFGLFGGRWFLPDFLSIDIGCTLLAGSYSLLYAAVREFQGKPSPRKTLLVPVIATFILALVFTENMPVRVALTGAILSLQAIVIARILFHDAPNRQQRSYWLTGVSFSMMAVVWILWGLEVFYGSREELSLVASTLYRSASLTVGLHGLILGNIGFLLMTREQAAQENERLATLDPLTETFNRRTFLDLVRREIARSRRSGRPLVLMMMDIDDFKRINDTYGHLAGDNVLRRLAAVTLSCLRRNDFFGRYGGEEFIVLLPETDGAGASLLAERLRSRIAEASVQEGPATVRWTVSIGLTVLHAADAAELDLLLRTADEALYSAKAQGKNRVVQMALPSPPK